MNIHEYQAKSVLARYGVPVPRGEVTFSASEAADIARAEMYLCDEFFLTGTAAELTPVREIDDHPLGPPGEVTRAIQSVFEDALTGRDERYAKWLDRVPVASKA